MQRVRLPDSKTIKQLRLAAGEGLISSHEFKILICPMLYIKEEGEDLPPNVDREVGPPSEPQEIGFKVEEEKQ